MYKNVYVGEVNIIQLVYNAGYGVLSRLCCTLQKYFGPVHHNQLKDNVPVNGMGGEMGRGGGDQSCTFLLCTTFPNGTR